MDKGRCNLKFKVGLIGDTNVGKTNIVSRFVRDLYSEDTSPTPGISTSFKNILKDKLIIELDIYDLGGHEKYREEAAKYIQEIDGCFIVYDITDKKSFLNIEQWYRKIKEKKPNIPIIIIGNKCDLAESREVSNKEAEEKAKELNCFYYETSALDANYINDIFKTMADFIFENKFPKRINVNMELNNEKEKKKNCCCDCCYDCCCDCCCDWF